MGWGLEGLCCALVVDKLCVFLWSLLSVSVKIDASVTYLRGMVEDDVGKTNPDCPRPPVSGTLQDIGND